MFPKRCINIRPLYSERHREQQQEARRKRAAVKKSCTKQLLNFETMIYLESEEKQYG